MRLKKIGTAKDSVEISNYKAPIEHRYDWIDKIDSFFYSGDRLSPAIELSRMSDLNIPYDEFFVAAKIKRLELIKEWGAVSAAIIPLIITVVRELVF